MNQKQLIKRGAGVLLPISSLSSPYGFGTLGKEAYEFVDFLKEAGFRYWQVLPVGPTSYGDSPYQSFSAFAGNPYMIDFGLLMEENLIMKEEVEQYNWGSKDDCIDYNEMFQSRFKVLKLAYNRSSHKNTPEYEKFCCDNQFWLKDYSFYMALKVHFNHVEWLAWDEDIKLRRKEAIEKYEVLLNDEIEFWQFCQFKFFEQWTKLKEYASENGILMIGDMPLYVAMDSADVWVHNDIFELDENRIPLHIAGVPPDAFSEEGQRWGNPLYRWDELEKRDFYWWRQRMKSASVLYDVIRIDHFIGIVNYYSIPSEEKSAKSGQWLKGPGRKLTNIMKECIGNSSIIAEDLGVLTDEVRTLIDETGYPGMKVVEFAFSGEADNDYLPHNYKTNNIISYIGTHDNETLAGYLDNCSKDQLTQIREYYNAKTVSEIMEEMIRTQYAGIPVVTLFQMQDLLQLGNEARTNTPSTLGGNWVWRLKQNELSQVNREKYMNYSKIYGRF